MWPTGLTLSSDVDHHVDVSDIFDLTPKAAAALAGLPNCVRAHVQEDLSSLFRSVLEIAFYSQTGAEDRLPKSDLIQQLQALLNGDVSCVTARFSVGCFNVSRNWYDPRILVSDIALTQ
jgi:hypothetical protein